MILLYFGQNCSSTSVTKKLLANMKFLLEHWEENIITIELMFTGVNMFLARLRLILARAAGEG